MRSPRPQLGSLCRDMTSSSSLCRDMIWDHHLDIKMMFVLVRRFMPNSFVGYWDLIISGSVCRPLQSATVHCIVCIVFGFLSCDRAAFHIEQDALGRSHHLNLRWQDLPPQRPRLRWHHLNLCWFAASQVFFYETYYLLTGFVWLLTLSWPSQCTLVSGDQIFIPPPPP